MAASCEVCGIATRRGLRCPAHRLARPCRACARWKTGRSPYCEFCRRDRLRGAQLILDPEWLERQGAKESRPARRPKDPKNHTDGLNWCSGCRIWLDPRWFLRLKEIKSGRPLPSVCRPCRSSRQHADRLKRDFGMTPKEYDDLLALQGGGCAICGGTAVTARLAVDHSHIDDRVRGLLCSKCNKDLLSAVRHSPRLAARAALYLLEPPAQTGRAVPEPELGTVFRH